MTAANILFAHAFDGALGDSWPGFSFPSVTFPETVNPTTWSVPAVDGHGRGLPSRAIGGVTWRGKSNNAPGRQAYRTALWAKWKNAGFAGRREVGIIVRYRGPNDCLIARLRSMGTAASELRLFKIEGGIETQLGSTYIGPDISATQMNAGVEWAVRVEDVPGTNDTKIDVYVGTQTAVERGTARISFTGDVGSLRGLHTVGIELTDQVYGDDVRVDNLVCYDLADEWNPTGPPPGAGAGWQVELGTTLYSLSQLSALTPPVNLMRVTQGYGQKGNSATFRVSGDYRQGTLLFPGQTVRVLHDGAVRFRGWVADGQLAAAPTESQDWNCYDAHWNARLVTLLRADKVGTFHYNVTDPENDEYDSTQQGKTLGQILKDQFDRNADALRFFGCAPPTGDAYVQTELDLLDAVIPDVTASGQFPVMVDTMLRFMGHKFVVWVDPGDLKWHFRDVTTLAQGDVSFFTEWATVKIKPDRDKAYTRVEWRGTRKANALPVRLKLSDGTLKPLWTKEQETKWGKSKRSRTMATGGIVSAGTGTAPDGVNRAFFDVQAGLFDQDDFRGGLAFVGSDPAERFIITNTSTRFWLSSPLWLSGDPPPGSGYVVRLVGPDVAAMFSAAGVGRGFVFDPQIVQGGCGTNASGLLSRSNLWQHGFCGSARVLTAGTDGTTHSEEYQYRVHVPNQKQLDAGFCDTTVVIAEKPLPAHPANFLPAGSVPTSPCVPGNTNAPARMPLVDIEIEVPVREDAAAWFAEPPDVGGRKAYRGPAFSDDPTTWDGGGEPYDDDWRVVQTYIVDDSDFVDVAQEAGLRKAAKAILDVKSQKQYLLEVVIATPWNAVSPLFHANEPTARWAGMTKRVTLSSAFRATQFEGAKDLQVFHVAWDVMGNQTVLQAGTASGWHQFEGLDISKAFNEARVLKRAVRMLKDVEDFRSCSLSKPPDRIGGMQQGQRNACEIDIINAQARRVVTLEQDDADKVRNITHGALRTWLDEELTIGPHEDNPGAPIAVPGRDGLAAKQAIDGPVLRSHADADIPFQGSSPGNNGDRGRYGGQIVTDAAKDGRPSREIYRRGGFAFRKREDAGGNFDGPPGLEFAALGTDGAPTGTWTAFDGVRSLPGQRAPLSMLRHGSTQHQLLQRSRELARALGRVEDAATQALRAPGEAGAPADLASMFRAAGVGNPWLRPVPESFDDPGGMVWSGPRNDLGADANLRWRVKAPEMLLMRVNQVTAGSGTNGGNFSWDTSGPGGTTEFLSSASVTHKQIDPVALSRDQTQSTDVGATPINNPFTFGPEGMLLNNAGSGTVNGAGGVLPIPPYARGFVGVWALLAEENSFGATEAAGNTYNVQIDYAWKASAWSSKTSGTAANVPVADGTGQGTGLFLAPGGAVPTGLRKPSDFAVSLVYSPGIGSASSNKGLNVLGIGVEVAVVEGGYALLVSEGMEASDAWTSTHAQPVERFLAMDVWATEATKGIAERIDILESWAIELNPVVSEFERLDASEAWAFEADKAFAESWSVSEVWTTVLNP